MGLPNSTNRLILQPETFFSKAKHLQEQGASICRLDDPSANPSNFLCVIPNAFIYIFRFSKFIRKGIGTLQSHIYKYNYVS